jgi:hypothetical protein
MKHLTLLLLLLALASICSAQAPQYPYVFNGSGITCAPYSNCFNYEYIPIGQYGSVYINGSARCTYSYPWAFAFQLNVFIEEQAVCVRSNTLLEAYIYSTSTWNYAPYNPWAINNVIWAAALQGTGVVYGVINNQAFNVGSEYILQDCYTGRETQSGGVGGTC